MIRGLLGAASTWIDALRARRALSKCAAVGAAPRVRGRLWIHGDGDVIIGDRVTFDGGTAPIELCAWAGATLVIGDDAHIDGGSSIEATASVTLGARTRLEGFCRIMDNHFHPLVGNRHARPAPRRVVIEDGVVLGAGAIVLAGSRVARGTRVPPGAVVRRAPGDGDGPREPPAPPPQAVEAPLNARYVGAQVVRIVRLLATDRKAARARIARGMGVVRAALLFRGCERGELVNALGHVRVVADGDLRLGDRVQLAGGMIPTELVCRDGGELCVGARTLFSYGVTVEATQSIRIGAGCMFASMARVRDADGHRVAAVVIEDDVWIAHGAKVEPGVKIGQGSVVAAGSVVRDDVPAYSLASGNPAVSVPLIGAPAPARPRVVGGPVAAADHFE